MTTIRRTTIFAAITAVMMVGAGCAKTGEQLANNAITPISVPVNALKQSQDTMALAKAKANENAELNSDEATIALVLLENGGDGGQEGDGTEVSADIDHEFFGCKDRLAFIKWPKKNTSQPLADALTALFAVGAKPPEGLHNGLAGSKLSVDKIVDDDTTEVYLKGETSLGGICDQPRFFAQIEGTIKRLRPNFKIFLNGSESAYRCVGDVKGDCT